MDAGDYKKASTCYLIGNVFNKGIAFLTVPIFTRILSTSDYGIVTTYNSWIGIVTMLLGFALHMAIRSSFIDYRAKVDEYLTSTLLFTVSFSVSMTVIVCSVSVLLNLPIPFIPRHCANSSCVKECFFRRSRTFSPNFMFTTFLWSSYRAVTMCNGICKYSISKMQ